MDKFREETRNALALIPDKGKMLFAVLTCEKLYPNYVYFQKISNWGESEMLMKGLNLMYQHLLKNDLFDVQIIKEVIASIDKITPDTEDFSTIFASFALDACTAIYSSLNFLLDDNIENIVDVAVYARDTVDMFIHVKNKLNSYDPTFELKMANDPFMIREKTRQRKLLLSLKTLKFDMLSDQMVESLRDRSPIIDLGALNIN